MQGLFPIQGYLSVKKIETRIAYGGHVCKRIGTK